MMFGMTEGNHDVCKAFEAAVARESEPVLQALHELVNCLPNSVVDGVLKDIGEYERTGAVSVRIKTILQGALRTAEGSQRSPV